MARRSESVPRGFAPAPGGRRQTSPGRAGRRRSAAVAAEQLGQAQVRLRLVLAPLALQRTAQQQVGVRLVGVVLEELGRDPDGAVELGGWRATVDDGRLADFYTYPDNLATCWLYFQPLDL